MREAQLAQHPPHGVLVHRDAEPVLGDAHQIDPAPAHDTVLLKIRPLFYKGLDLGLLRCRELRPNPASAKDPNQDAALSPNSPPNAPPAANFHRQTCW